jgi:hypothetical protein
MRLLSALLALLATSLAAEVHSVYQFRVGTWLENIVETRNDSLLVSVLGTAEVHIINPYTSSHTPPSASRIATFPEANAVLGMTELRKNVFAVAVGNITKENAPVPETFSIWSIDIRVKDESAKVNKIANIFDVSMVNGMAALAALSSAKLLLADSWAGNIVAFDTETGDTEVVIEHPTLLPDFNASLPLGVNGLKIHDGYVYYTNTVQRLVGRVPIDKDTGKPTGDFEILASGTNISVPDDLAVDSNDGSVYVSGPLAAPEGDTLQHIALTGEVTTVARGGLVSGTTAPVLGNSKKYGSVVYLSTMGGFGENGQPKTGGRVVAVEL